MNSAEIFLTYCIRICLISTKTYSNRDIIKRERERAIKHNAISVLFRFWIEYEFGPTAAKCRSVDTLTNLVPWQKVSWKKGIIYTNIEVASCSYIHTNSLPSENGMRRHRMKRDIYHQHLLHFVCYNVVLKIGWKTGIQIQQMYYKIYIRYT